MIDEKCFTKGLHLLFGFIKKLIFLVRVPRAQILIEGFYFLLARFGGFGWDFYSQGK
jgi:hypothetical protein